MNDFMVDYLERVENYFQQLKDGINGISEEGLNWKPADDMNSLGVIVTHVMGSFRFWVGDVALEENSNRVRDDEFSVANATKSELITLIDKTMKYLVTNKDIYAGKNLADSVYSKPHDENFTIGWRMLHALEHTAVHTGHLQVTRQFWLLQK